MNNDLQKAIDQLHKLDLPHFFEGFKQIEEIVESLKNQPVHNNTMIQLETSDIHKKIKALVASEQFSKTMSPFWGSSIQTVIAAASLQLDHYAKTFKYLTEKLKNISFPSVEDISETLKMLAMYGWYINYSFLPRATGELRQFLDANEITLMDQYMVENIEEIYKDQKCNLLRYYIERNGPLSAAFNAHERGEYYLSIPVFFAQVDGICKEHTAVSFFLKENRTFLPRVRNWVLAEQRFEFNRAMAAALLVNGAFQLYYTEENKIEFTRHSVMHGEYSNYGTMVNSYKALSLLFYVSDVCAPSAHEGGNY